MLQNHKAIRLVVLAVIVALTISLNIPPSQKSQRSLCSNMDDVGSCDSNSAISLPNLSAFGYELFSHVANTTSEPNVLLSPFSIASALALVLAGATPDSTCQSEIQSALSVSSHSQIPALSQQILHSSSDTNPDGGGGDESVQLTSANGLWIAKSIMQSYTKVAQHVHGAKVSPLPETFAPIDAYITAKTNGMIENMLEGPIDPLTKAVLINAVYFKGAWKTKFDLDKSEEGRFKSNNGGEPRKAVFMKSTRRMKVATHVKELGQANIISLEYGKSMNVDESIGVISPEYRNNMNEDKSTDDSDFSAIFLLPPENTSDSLSNVFSSLAILSKSTDGTSLGDILEKTMNYERVQLLLPRFRISYGTESLKSPLQSMGIQAAFAGDNNFLRMSEDPEVYLDDVLHKATMEVTEEGTVAAAATAGIMRSRSMPSPPIDMIFDRPFGMVVVHTPSMTPLFVARVNDPDFI